MPKYSNYKKMIGHWIRITEWLLIKFLDSYILKTFNAHFISFKYLSLENSFQIKSFLV